MKKRAQGIITGVLIGAIMTSGAVFAKQASETIHVVYDNIKILIDGKEYQPTDVSGNAVEPFIYNGTTYLPVRAIANAFDKEVDWEAQTSTVTLGSKKYDWLDQMGYVDYKVSHNATGISAIETGTKDNTGRKLDRGLRFKLHEEYYESDNDGTARSYLTAQYLLNGAYNNFTGDIVSFASDNAQSAILKFYGDGNLLYASPIISKGTKITPFNIDISQYKILKIHAEIQNFIPEREWITADYYTSFGIADARLSKK